MKIKSISYLMIIIINVVFNRIDAQNLSPSIPHLDKKGTATKLIVDSKPFLILGGELGNSSSTSLEYMAPIWPKLKAMNLNILRMQNIINL